MVDSEKPAPQDDFPEEAYSKWRDGQDWKGIGLREAVSWAWARAREGRADLQVQVDGALALTRVAQAERDAALKYRDDWWALSGYLFPDDVRDMDRDVHTLDEMQAGIRTILDERDAARAKVGERIERAMQLKSDLAAALALVRKVEWAGSEARDLPTDRLFECCPVCFGWNPGQDHADALAEWRAEWNARSGSQYGPARTLGHAPDCKLAALLELENKGEASSPTLLPCPFCGGSASFDYEEFSDDGERVEIWSVSCEINGCNGRSGTEESKDGAAMMWNARDVTALVSQVLDTRAAPKD